MERFLMEYLVNSIWQVPLLAAGAWLTLRAVRPGPRAQHRVWVGVLPLMLLIPFLTLHHAPTAHVDLAPAPAAAPPSTLAPLTVDLPANMLAPASSLPMETADQPAGPMLTPAPTAQSSGTVTVRASWHAMHELTLTPSATHWLVGLYLAAIAFMAMRLLSSAWAARRLVAQADTAVLSDAASRQLDRCCEHFAVARPKVLLSPHASSPMIVGAMRPTLLLPQPFAPKLQQPDHELEAVWLHELAHLQRRDHLANLICRIAALPIAYHPAAHVVQQQIRQTREMVCDEMAAAAMQSPLGYARCLVGLAGTMHGLSPRIEAVGMFENGILEERIMQLTKTKTLVSSRTRMIRFAGGTAMMLAVLAAPAIFHVTPTLAQATGISLPAAAVTPAAVPAAATPAAAPQPPDQPQSAAPAKTYTPPASAAEPVESRKNIAEAKASEAQSKTLTAESATQLEAARKRLDDAAKTYTDLAAKSADGSAKSAATDTAEARRQLEDARKQLADANRAWNEQIARTVDSAIREKQFTIDRADLNKHVAELQARFNSPEFKEQMEKLSQQMAEAQAKFNSPEWKAKIDKLNSPEFKKQLEEAQARLSSPEFKEKTEKLAAEIAKAQTKFNSPEWKAQMDRLNSPEFKKQIEESQWRLQNSDILKQMGVLNDDVSKQMDEVRSEIDHALELWRANAPTQ
jgi:beta-lactamase regulating signal transducer with metallopeptidase domain